MKILSKKLNTEEFKKYIEGKNFKPNDPNKLVIHHTYKPTEKTWAGLKTIDALDKYYRGLGWNGLGPHIFVAPDGIWLFTDMSQQGTHAGVGNYRSIGIEVVGNYDGAKWTGEIKRQTLSVINDLVDELNLKMEDIRFHSEFNKSKSCPGWAITKEWLEDKLIEFRKEPSQKIELVSESKTEIHPEDQGKPTTSPEVNSEPLTTYRDMEEPSQTWKEIIGDLFRLIINLKIWNKLKTVLTKLLS